MRICTSLLTIALSAVLLTGVAAAQDGKPAAAPPPADKAPAAADKKAPAAADKKAPAAADTAPAAADKAPVPAAAAQPAPPAAPAGDALSAKCLSEIKADPQWKEQLRNELRKIVGVPEVNPPAGGHESVMRSACNNLMRTNIAFRDQVREKVLLPDVRAQLADVIRIDVHKADANRMLRNRRHVLYTYSFLWVCMVGLVVFMWRRQHALAEEIERLRRDLDKAADD